MTAGAFGARAFADERIEHRDLQLVWRSDHALPSVPNSDVWGSVAHSIVVDSHAGPVPLCSPPGIAASGDREHRSVPDVPTVGVYHG